MGSGAPLTVRTRQSEIPPADDASGGGSASSSQSSFVQAASGNARVTLNSDNGLAPGLTIKTTPKRAILIGEQMQAAKAAKAEAAQREKAARNADQALASSPGSTGEQAQLSPVPEEVRSSSSLSIVPEEPLTSSLPAGNHSPPSRVGMQFPCLFSGLVLRPQNRAGSQGQIDVIKTTIMALNTLKVLYEIIKGNCNQPAYNLSAIVPKLTLLYQNFSNQPADINSVYVYFLEMKKFYINQWIPFGSPDSNKLVNFWIDQTISFNIGELTPKSLGFNEHGLDPGVDANLDNGVHENIKISEIKCDFLFRYALHKCGLDVNSIPMDDSLKSKTLSEYFEVKLELAKTPSVHSNSLYKALLLLAIHDLHSLPAYQHYLRAQSRQSSSNLQ